MSQTTAAALLAQSDGLTLPRLVQRNADEHGDRPALTDGAVTLTWAELRTEIAAMTRGLHHLGLARGERFMIMMSSRLEHWIADHAATHLAAMPCTAYATLSPDQIRYVAQHSAASVVVLEGAAELERWTPLLPELTMLRHLIVLDDVDLPDDPRARRWADVRATGRGLHAGEPEVFEALWAGIAADDPLAMMYTSGTTGDPKAVVLTHRNAIYEALSVNSLVETPQHGHAVSYLPLAHIAERELSFYLAAFKCLHITICADPTLVVGALAQVHPTSFFGVPRVWEKVASALRAMLAGAQGEQKDSLDAAHALLVEGFRIKGRGEEVPAELAARIAAADAEAMLPIRTMLGLDQLDWASSGSAPISVEIIEFLAGLGIDVMEVWGMSETCGAATLNLPEAYRPGSVGRAAPGIEVMIAADGELLVRGPIVFAGYLKADGSIDPDREADGWFATGDIATIDDDGFVTITDRKKELIITSSGKNIAPTKIEGLLRTHPLVGYAIAIGDNRSYLTALITLDEEAAPLWAQARGISGTSIAELAAEPVVVAEIEALVAASNAKLARIEQIKTYQLLPQAWSPDSGELTPTLKLKRRVVHDRYATEIDALYA